MGVSRRGATRICTYAGSTIPATRTASRAKTAQEGCRVLLLQEHVVILWEQTTARQQRLKPPRPKIRAQGQHRPIARRTTSLARCPNMNAVNLEISRTALVRHMRSGSRQHRYHLLTKMGAPLHMHPPLMRHRRLKRPRTAISSKPSSTWVLIVSGRWRQRWVGAR